MGRRDHANVDLRRLRGADGLEGPLLEHPEQLDLQGGAHVPDLVEEDGAAVGEGEASLAMPDGVREGALDVAEELGLEQLLGNGAAVDGDQGPLRAPTVVVECPRDQLLAGAALARDQHRALGVRDPLDHAEHASDRVALADDAVEFVAAPELAMQLAVLLLQPPVLDRLLDQRPDDVERLALEGLLEVPEGAGLERLDGVSRRVVPRHHDAGQVGLDLVDLTHQLQAVQARHLDVAQDEVDAGRGDEVERLGGVARGRDLVADARQDALDGPSVELLVVDDEDLGLLHRWDGLRSAEGAR